MIASTLSTRDRLNLRAAYPDTAAAPLLLQQFLQKGLYLMIHPFDYNQDIQYNQKMEAVLKPFLKLPLTHLPPNEKEEHFALTYADLEHFGLLPLTELDQTFPKVESLKIVMRGNQENFYVFQTKLQQVLVALSGQLTSLQILVSSDDDEEGVDENNHISPTSRLELYEFIKTLNSCEWPRLKNFGLVLEENCAEESEFSDTIKDPKWELKMLATVEQCHLRVPGKLLLNQLKLLEESTVLNEFGFIVDAHYDKTAAKQVAQAMLFFKPIFASKINHMHLNGFKDYGENHASLMVGNWPMFDEDGANDGEDGDIDDEDGDIYGEYGDIDGEYGDIDGEDGDIDGEDGHIDGEDGDYDGEDGASDGEDENVVDESAGRIRHFTHLTSWSYSVSSESSYLCLLGSLAAGPATAHLQSLSIDLRILSAVSETFFFISHHSTFCLPSVTSLHLRVVMGVEEENNSEGRYYPGYQHKVLKRLALAKHFPRLQSLSLDIGGMCCLCTEMIGVRKRCIRALLKPLKGLTQLRQLEVRCRTPCQVFYIARVVDKLLQVIERKRQLAMAKTAGTETVW